MTFVINDGHTESRLLVNLSESRPRSGSMVEIHQNYQKYQGIILFLTESRGQSVVTDCDFATSGFNNSDQSPRLMTSLFLVNDR